jgi:protein-S-isoprenylcysteine O-methyltransferase Ste14
MMTARIHPLMRIPVPWVFVLAYLAGAGLQQFLPLPAPSAQVLMVSHVTGAALMAGGAALAAWSLRLFRAARTTTVPFGAPAQLVTWGPYRFTRNPMYISLILVYLGEGGILAQLWPLLLLPLVVTYVHRTVIPVEEARLRKVVGKAYEQYCARVRRWI